MATKVASNVAQSLAARANLLRIDSIRATTEAGSGHPTTCMSAAEIMSVLFFHEMKYDPKDPQNPTNDRFVLSKGHGAPVLYAAWAQAGLFPREHLLTLRDIDSDLEGHPTPRLPFADVATGSLGQGLGAGIGIALNARLDKSGYRTFVLLGDGEVAEGSVWEAANLAPYYKLDDLVAIIDVNAYGQSQKTMLAHELEVYKARFEAFGWHTQTCDGHSVEELMSALEKAREHGGKPHMIVARTLKGKGASFSENVNGWHGKPFTKEQTEQAIKEIETRGAEVDGAPDVEKPQRKMEKPAATKPMEAPAYAKDAKVATREAYGEALVKLGAANPAVVALDADVKNSTYSEKFMKAYPDRFFECFIAEQNMISVAAGLAARGKIPFASSFAVFLSRGYDQVRMAGISFSNLKLCGSHVGVSIGEDGPSQMGLEDIALYRAIPNCVVFYPSDAIAAERSVELAANYKGMAYIRTSRPKTAILYDNGENFEIGKAKVLKKSDKDAATIVAAGVTLHEALKAYDALQKDGISVRIVDIFTVKPIDEKTLVESGKATNNLIITVEDHYPEGGIGEAVLSAVAGSGVRVVKMAVTEVPRSGAPDELVAKYRIDSAAIIAKVKSLV